MSVYAPAFVEFRPILSDEDRALLHALAARYPLSRLQREARNYEEMRIDFVHTSAKIEGNTYTRAETDALLRLGVTAGGKRYSDAVMLINLRDAFERAMLVESGAAIDREYVCGLHEIAMRELLPASQVGVVRAESIAVGGTEYRPLDDPRRLRVEFDAILETAKQYDDPFDRAIYLHCNLAYLQPCQIPMRLTVMTTGASGEYHTLWGVIEFPHTARGPAEVLRRCRRMGERPILGATRSAAISDLRRVGRNVNMIDWDQVKELEDEQEVHDAH